MPKTVTVPLGVRNGKQLEFPDGTTTVDMEVLKFSEFQAELVKESFQKDIYSDYLGKEAAAAKQNKKLKLEKELKGEARAAKAEWKKDIYAD